METPQSTAAYQTWSTPELSCDTVASCFGVGTFACVHPQDSCKEVTSLQDSSEHVGWRCD